MRVINLASRIILLPSPMIKGTILRLIVVCKRDEQGNLGSNLKLLMKMRITTTKSLSHTSIGEGYPVPVFPRKIWAKLALNTKEICDLVSKVGPFQVPFQVIVERESWTWPLCYAVETVLNKLVTYIILSKDEQNQRISLILHISLGRSFYSNSFRCDFSFDPIPDLFVQ